MPGSSSEYGAEKLAAIGAKLKAEGSGPLRRKAAGALRAEAGPLARKTADEARSRLPHGGGLNDLVADRHVTISVLMSARSAGVRLKKKDAASYQTNRGFINHHVYGGEAWVRQELPGAAGWWTDTLHHAAPEVTASLLEVINVTAREIGA